MPWGLTAQGLGFRCWDVARLPSNPAKSGWSHAVHDRVSPEGSIVIDHLSHAEAAASFSMRAAPGTARKVCQCSENCPVSTQWHEAKASRKAYSWAPSRGVSKHGAGLWGERSNKPGLCEGLGLRGLTY